jgi:hypothetical protein
VVDQAQALISLARRFGPCARRSRIANSGSSVGPCVLCHAAIPAQPGHLEETQGERRSVGVILTGISAATSPTT